MKLLQIYLFLFAVLTGASVPSWAETLISEKEAALPPMETKPASRSIVRGPVVKWVSPKNEVSVNSPFELKVLLEAREGVKIDQSSLKVIYLKSPPVDLTPRLKSSITPNGIEITQAEVPPGSHTIRLTIKDLEGRETNSQLTIKVNQ
ncbi:MAG: hypothetical protein Q7J51_07130 [Sheuella sp.]|jgi:hypothetical protein|nr:hypothetical protein [Sheuella sp.]